MSDRDKEVLLLFCPHFQRILPENPDLLNIPLLKDEAHFHLHGTFNKQNFRYSAATNPHELHEHAFYDSKITVWCAICSTGVSGPYFFEYEDTQGVSVISKLYAVVINEYIAPKIPSNHNLCLQQDGAKAHTAVIRTSALRAFVSSTGDFSFR